MTTASGWYPDPSNEQTMRFWNGTQWKGERSLGQVATAPVATAPLATAPVASADVVPAAAPAGAATRVPMTPNAWFLFGGAAIAALGSLLPWEQDTTPLGTHVTAGPTSVAGGAAMLLGLLAVVVWIAWPSRVGSLSKARRLGLMAVAGLLAFMLFAKLSALGNASTHSASADSGLGVFGDTPSMTYGPGLGLFVYGAGVAAIWIGITRAWLKGRVRPETIS